jgi:POT family proton-dependent oligopeptide transporter
MTMDTGSEKKAVVPASGPGSPLAMSEAAQVGARGGMPGGDAADVSLPTKGHPKGLYLLFVTEMWERFSYYGMRAIFVLYLTNALVFNKSAASKLYGSYTGLVYLTPLLGGYMADRYWGNRRSIIIGGLLMALGQFCMFVSGSLYREVDVATALMFTGLGLLIFGNGFFKPNISTMVGQLYPPKDRRVDSAFTIFYMGINLGAFLAPIICGGLGEHYAADKSPLPEYFRWGFLAAGVGMLISLTFFILYKDRYIVTPAGQPIGTEPNKAHEAETAGPSDEALPVTQIAIWGAVLVLLGLVFYHLSAFGWVADVTLMFRSRPDYNALITAAIFAAGVAMPGFILSERSLTGVERQRIVVIIVAAVFVIFFWGAFEQAGASLTFFAAEQTDRSVGWHIPMWAVHVASVALIALLTWLLVRGGRALRGEPVSLSVIFHGLVGAAIAFVVGLNIYLVYIGQPGIDVRDVPASYFQSINAIAIVIFAPIFSIMWRRLGDRGLEPPSPMKQALGILLLALGYLLIAMRVRDLNPAVKVSMFWLTALYVIHTWGELCLSPIGLSMVAKLSPIRFASLLMGVWFLSNAAANNFAGKLSELYPPGENEVRQAAKVGIDLPPILDKQATPTAEQLQKLEEIGVRASYPAVLGFEIRDLFQFFMIFVVLAGAASVVLMMLTPWLIRMMHGVR